MKQFISMLRFLGYTLVSAFAVNFAALVLSLFILRGSAWDGKVEGQRYYLGSHHHYTEVSRGIFRLSQLLEDGFFVTLTLAFVGGGLSFYGADKIEQKIKTIRTA